MRRIAPLAASVLLCAIAATKLTWPDRSAPWQVWVAVPVELSLALLLWVAPLRRTAGRIMVVFGLVAGVVALIRGPDSRCGCLGAVDLGFALHLALVTLVTLLGLLVVGAGGSPPTGLRRTMVCPPGRDLDR